MNLFGWIAYLFHIIFYQPLLNALILLYIYFPGHDFGVAIVALTVIIRLLLYPLLAESIRIQKVTNELQPKVKEIQEKYKNDKERQVTLQMQLYKEHDANPFNGILLTLIQLPVLIALYLALRQGLGAGVSGQLYSFVHNPGAVNPMFFNLIDLSKQSHIMVLAAGVLQFFQSKMLFPAVSKSNAAGQKGDQMQTAMQQQMLYMGPIITIIFFWNFPAALSLYWVVASICAIIQQKIIFASLAKKTAKPD
jgi:YidC/Oxa1 family membrane protein insertase